MTFGIIESRLSNSHTKWQIFITALKFVTLYLDYLPTEILQSIRDISAANVQHVFFISRFSLYLSVNVPVICLECVSACL